MNAIDTEFSLRRTIRAVLDESSETDPAVLAEIALDRIGEDDLRAALAEALPGYVRVQINRDNMNIRQVASRDAREAVQAVGSAVQQSWKVRGIRAHGRSFRESILRQRLFVKGADGRSAWRLYGDFDPDDLRNLMNDRTGDAQEILAEVERHARVLEQCEGFGGVRVRDLPEDVLFKAWGHES